MLSCVFFSKAKEINPIIGPIANIVNPKDQETKFTKSGRICIETADMANPMVVCTVRVVPTSCWSEYSEIIAEYCAESGTHPHAGEADD